jgi:hypothetical protein
MACKKAVDAQPSSKPLPRGLVGWFEDACPAGWSPATALQGRYLVGLPPTGAAGATFGGPPLAPGELRTHTHPVTASVATTPKGIALLSGCCGDGYAQKGNYSFAGPSAPASAAIPYLPLAACTVD